MPGHLHDAGKGLHQRVIAGHGPALFAAAEGAEVVIKNVRVDGAYSGLPNADAVGHAGSHALDHDLATGHQRHGDFNPLLLFEVNHHAAFACAHVPVRQAHAVDKRRPRTCIVTLRRFHLDDICTQLRQDHRAVGACHI